MEPAPTPASLFCEIFHKRGPDEKATPPIVEPETENQSPARAKLTQSHTLGLGFGHLKQGTCLTQAHQRRAR